MNKSTNSTVGITARRVFLVFAVALSALFLFPVKGAKAQYCNYYYPGCLDPSFNQTGIVMTDTNGMSSGDLDEALGVAVQADGKIVAVGASATPGSATHFVVARYNSDGSLDPYFGPSPGGIVKTSFSTGQDYANAVALQSDGKIIAAGYASPSTGRTFAIARYNVDGSLDSTFGSGGKTTVGFVCSNNKKGLASMARSGAIQQADGKIVLAGNAQCGPSLYGALARLNIDGTLDTSFGIGGKVLSSMYDGWGVGIQSNGKIVLGGQASSKKTGFDFALMRYNINGSLHTTFGNGGIVTTDFSASDDRIRAIRIDANDNIFAFGSTGSAFAGLNFAVVRFTSNGTLVFKTATDIFGNWDEAYAGAIQPDGKIIAAGFAASSDGSLSYFALVRYNADGTLDKGFGTAGTGIVTLEIAGTNNNFGNALALVGQPTDGTGRIIVGGTAYSTTGPAFLTLLRYFQ